MKVFFQIKNQYFSQFISTEATPDNYTSLEVTNSNGLKVRHFNYSIVLCSSNKVKPFYNLKKVNMVFIIGHKVQLNFIGPWIILLQYHITFPAYP